MNFHTDALGGRNANVCSAAAAQDRHGASGIVLSDAIILYRDRPTETGLKLVGRVDVAGQYSN